MISRFIGEGDERKTQVLGSVDIAKLGKRQSELQGVVEVIKRYGLKLQELADNQKLLDMNAFLDDLPAPKAPRVDLAMFSRGRELFRTNCTSCHNVDQSKFVPPTLIKMKTIWPAYTPFIIGIRGDKKLSHILNSPGGFDDKMVIVDASDRGEIRGNAMPLLLDLDRTTLFLHDASVPSLDNLLDPMRGRDAPHPFYIADRSERDDMVEFLRGLDTEPIKPG